MLTRQIRKFCCAFHANRARRPKKRPSSILNPYCMVFCLVQTILGCGLPQVVLLDKPKKLERVHASDGTEQSLPSTVVAFAFPDDDTNIIGYVIYYKVYYSGISDPDYINDNDKKHFDENSYIGPNNEMQPGSIIPNKRGFLKLGEFGKSELGEYYIAHNGSQKAVYIDFDPGGSGASDSNLREEPIIGYDYPVTKNNKIKVLARGFIDPTDVRGSTETYPGDKLRSFVKDWEYDFGGDGYNDGDLRRGYSLLEKQPGLTVEVIRSCGVPYFKVRTPVQLRIGFVVHSYGRIKGSLQPVTSKPVYLGDVVYSPVHDANRNRSQP